MVDCIEEKPLGRGKDESPSIISPMKKHPPVVWAWKEKGKSRVSVWHAQPGCFGQEKRMMRLRRELWVGEGMEEIRARDRKDPAGWAGSRGVC